MFVALTAICSQIMIPLPFTPVPINLALLAVWVCVGALGAKKGAIAMIVYILLGVIGAPVFAGLQGGPGVLTGPLGGYIIGFLPAAVLYGLLVNPATDKRNPWFFNPSARCRGNSPARYDDARNQKPVAGALLAIVRGLPALIACYALGTAWFVVSTGNGVLAAMLVCVVPFIPGDILKLAGAAAICAALRKSKRSLPH